MKQVSCLFLIITIVSCHRPVFKTKWIQETSPEHFTAVFETSKGSFEIEATRQWSPLAADRLFAQIKHGYYDHTLFYRVRPNWVAQFGGDDSAKIKNWGKYKVPDEPVLHPNTRGTVSFATNGKESRGNDLFINLSNNSPQLDTVVVSGIKGYPVIAVVTKNMNVVDSLYQGYGDRIFGKYETLLHNKKAFLESFPKLDSVKRVFFVKAGK